MALLPLASGNEARGFWARTVASSIRRLVRRKSPSSASANSWTAQGVSADRLLIRRSCVQMVILGRIQGFHALSIPPGTLKQKLWVTGSPPHWLRRVRRKNKTCSDQPLNGQGSVAHVLAHPLFGGHGKPSHPCVSLQHTALRKSPRKRTAFFIWQTQHPGRSP